MSFITYIASYTVSNSCNLYLNKSMQIIRWENTHRLASYRKRFPAKIHKASQ